MKGDVKAAWQKNKGANYSKAVKDRKVSRDGVKGGAKHSEKMAYIVGLIIEVLLELEKAQDKEDTILQHAKVSKVLARPLHVAPC